jgi:hypothetical protein
MMVGVDSNARGVIGQLALGVVLHAAWRDDGGGDGVDGRD